MSHLSDNSPDFKALDHIRKNLYQLANGLGALRRDLENEQPLPSWPSIQNATNLLNNQLKTLYANLTEANVFLHRAHVYPTPAFPGRTQDNLLQQLLRKKLDPKVEDWVLEGAKAAESLAQPNGPPNGTAKAEEKGLPPLNEREIDELWEWAGPGGNEVARKILFEEEDDEEDDGEDEDEGSDEEDLGGKMDVDAKKAGLKPPPVPDREPMALERVLGFMYTGVLPPAKPVLPPMAKHQMAQMTQMGMAQRRP